MEKEFENNVAQLQPKLLLQFSPNKNNNILNLIERSITQIFFLQID